MVAAAHSPPSGDHTLLPDESGKRGLKRSMAAYARGIPLGVVAARRTASHDSLLLAAILDVLKALIRMPEQPARAPGPRLRFGQHPPTAAPTRLGPVISGKRAVSDGQHEAVGEGTTYRYGAYKKLGWCTGRRGIISNLWVALSYAVPVVKRLF